MSKSILILLALAIAGCAPKPVDWRQAAAHIKPEDAHRADYAYDAGGIRARGEHDGRFRIEAMQVTIQPGPFGGPIPDTLLIVAPLPGADPIGGRFTVVDSIFEVTNGLTDTTLIVRPH